MNAPGHKLDGVSVGDAFDGKRKFQSLFSHQPFVMVRNALTLFPWSSFVSLCALWFEGGKNFHCFAYKLFAIQRERSATKTLSRTMTMKRDSIGKKGR